MKAQSGKTGKGAAGRQNQVALKYVSPAQKKQMDAKRRAAEQSISQRKPGQRAGMAKTRAAAKKKAR